jgi:predicted dehydrogenase
VIRVGIVGFGKMGMLHASILGALPGVGVVGVCDRNRMVTRLVAKALAGVRVCSDVTDFAPLDLDAVYVTTLPTSHCALVTRIYGNRIARSVFVEKSLAASAEQGREMRRLAQRNGVTMVGYQKRFGVTFRAAKQLLDDGAVGEIRSFDAYAYSSDFLGASAEATTALLRGGVLRDSGCHAIDVALWYFGGLEVLAASNGSRANAHDGHPGAFDGRRPEDFVSASVETTAGIQGTFSVSSQMEGYRLPEIGMSVSGSEGMLKVNDDCVELRNDRGQAGRWYRHDLNDQVRFGFGPPDYFRENEAFVRAVTTGEHEGSSFEAGGEVEEVIDRIAAMCS